MNFSLGFVHSIYLLQSVGRCIIPYINNLSLANFIHTYEKNLPATVYLFCFLVVILSVPLGELRSWMVEATRQKMHKGDFVFIYVNQQTPDQGLYDTLTSPDFIQSDDGDNSRAKKGYRNLFMVSWDRFDHITASKTF